MSAAIDSLVSVVWNREPQTAYRDERLTTLELACVEGGYGLIETLMTLPAEEQRQLPERVRAILAGLERLEEAYAMLQSPVREDSQTPPATRGAA